MIRNLPRVTLAVLACCPCLLAQTTTEGLGGQQLVARAASQLARYKTIAAKLRVSTDVMGQPLVGSGAYAQLAATSGMLLRLELTIQAGGQAVSFKQICNGPYLMELWRMGDQENLHHVDLTRVSKELAKRGDPPSRLTASLARGGLPKLLAQLNQHFDFAAAPVSGKLKNEPTWRVEGTWKEASRSALVPDAPQRAKWPTHLPQRVELYLGQKNLFPYQIRYLRERKGKLAPEVVSAEFYHISIDQELDPRQFVVQQADTAKTTDRTDAFLEALGVARRQRPGEIRSR